jgi:hypothetical protein
MIVWHDYGNRNCQEVPCSQGSLMAALGRFSAKECLVSLRISIKLFLHIVWQRRVSGTETSPKQILDEKTAIIESREVLVFSLCFGRRLLSV